MKRIFKKKLRSISYLKMEGLVERIRVTEELNTETELKYNVVPAQATGEIVFATGCLVMLMPC